MNLQDYLQASGDKPVGLLSRSSDLVLAALLVAIIALMILPLPRVMIDVLVALNITMGVMLVLMSIYIGSALQFSAFPSVLLITTLFRLALSVATTRMILLHGDAGSIITTFGNVVAGGNLVVGLVVFLIITLVQFLVIAKGAERVAEVGARFTLDAMPGKQLSIDSDLRSGLIDKTEAREKRRELELESKLHGSMDGAMKFVKGDAIAGIVIIVINLLGGLAIGIWQRGMDASAAMSKYSILTIGDGLVAQIPALLGAMSAGLIVTRATDNKQDRHLGDSIQKQFAAIPRVMLVAGGICFLLSLVPGFPTMVFFGLAVFLLMTGGLLIPTLRMRFEKLSSPSFNRVMEGKVSNHKLVSPAKGAPMQQAVPLLLELPGHLAVDGVDEALQTAVTECVDSFQLRSGVALPEIKIHFSSRREAGWELLAFEVPIVSEASLDPEVNLTDAVVPVIAGALRRQATLFLGIQETTQLMAMASVDYPDIVKELLRTVPAQTIAAVLRNLVSEDVSIRNLRGIFEALLQAAQNDKDPSSLTEHARIALARQTCYRYAPTDDLRAIALAPALEEELMKSLRTNGDVQQLALKPRQAERLRNELIAQIDQHHPEVLLTSVPLRRHVRSLIALERFDTPVLSYNELLPHLKLNIAAQITAEKAALLATA